LFSQALYRKLGTAPAKSLMPFYALAARWISSLAPRLLARFAVPAKRRSDNA